MTLRAEAERVFVIFVTRSYIRSRERRATACSSRYIPLHVSSLRYIVRAINSAIFVHVARA